MKFMWGLLLGFGMGVAAGLLLAPQSGEEIRTRIGEQGMVLPGNVPDDLRTFIADLSEDLRVRAGDAMVVGRELYSRTKDELSQRYGQAKSGSL